MLICCTEANLANGLTLLLKENNFSSNESDPVFPQYLPSCLSCCSGTRELPKGDLHPPQGFTKGGGTSLTITRIALIPVWRLKRQEEEDITFCNRLVIVTLIVPWYFSEADPHLNASVPPVCTWSATCERSMTAPAATQGNREMFCRMKTHLIIIISP